MHKRSLFIFRQDLRIHDNTALNLALSESEEVMVIFIFDDRAKSEFWEHDTRFGFIREMLEVADKGLRKVWWRVYVYSGKPEIIVPEIVMKHTINHVYANRTYGRWWIERDANITQRLIKKWIWFTLCDDFLLVPIETVPVRKVFTPFFNIWKTHLSTVRIHSLTKGRFFVIGTHPSIHEVMPHAYHPFFRYDFGVKRLREFDFANYINTRNFPWMDGSTRLSPYIRFGVFSIREVLEAMEESQTLVSELAWREFWYHIAYHFPATFHEAFQEKKRNIIWENNTHLCEKIEAAETGYPLIDAAIRQLKTTNWMHNRLRMVVASFITKNCLIDWQWGEKFFKRYLIDYDEAVNFGNWQWSASVGADPKPLRIFNPLLQSEKFDEQALFIKKYIPELAEVSPKDIHTLDLEWIYFPPIVDQKQSAWRAKQAYYEHSENSIT